MSTIHLNNRYQVIQVLGDGGFGQTFLAEDTYMPSRRCCVIKQLKPIANAPQTYQIIQQRFEREAATLEYLGENNNQIPKLYAYFLENGQFYLVQEWIKGQTLRDIVITKGLVNETTVRKILVSLLSVLDYVHSQGIIHRDIKPDNIILRSHDLQPVLIDFGAVKETIRSEIGVSFPTHSIIIGTPGYMPSEQAVGRPVYASDIYSLGLTAIYLLTGKNPQELPTNPQTGEICWLQHAPHVSLDLAKILNLAIKPQASDRFDNANKMLYALQSLTCIPVSSNQSTQTVIASPFVTSTTQPLSYSQKSNFIPTSATSENWQKPVFLFGGLVAGFLMAATAITIMTHQSQPAETTIASSPLPENTQRSSVINPSPEATPITSLSQPKNTPVASQTSRQQTIIPVSPFPTIAYTPSVKTTPELPISSPQLGSEHQQKITTNTDSENFRGFSTDTNSSPVSPNVSELAKSEAVISPEKVVSSQEISSNQINDRKGYCTYLATNKKENTVDDPCLIHDYKNGNYKLIWSNGKESFITSNSEILVDNAPASIIKSGANHMTLQSTQGKIGFCWNCTP
jgi:serine/threonine protein kinase, bacterial